MPNLPNNAYTPYDLLRLLIDRVGWPVSSEQQLARESVDIWERMQIFGNLASMTACQHQQHDRNGRCIDCGSLLPYRQTKKG